MWGPLRPSVRAVEGRLLEEHDAAGLRDAAVRAEAEGADAVFLGNGPLGDPFVLAAALSSFTRRVLLGVRVRLSDNERHPTVLAREATSLDLVCDGRTVLCFLPPFTDGVCEAIALCRALWRDGMAEHGGPEYPVEGAVNRPRPSAPGPRVALDLTEGGDVPPAQIVAAADLLLRPMGEADRILVETA
jgi:alkanesulfonate monooxygenase SsuD/methylene tetrahydromethanopterin reductase-like flavin-dependent oxidoreductase (luciferase family)